jgi:hypothetical protein
MEIVSQHLPYVCDSQLSRPSTHIKLGMAIRSICFLCNRFNLLFFRILTPYEAKSLVAMLHTKDSDMLEKALVTVSNSAAFTQNQVSNLQVRSQSAFLLCAFLAVAWN